MGNDSPVPHVCLWNTDCTCENIPTGVPLEFSLKACDGPRRERRAWVPRESKCVPPYPKLWAGAAHARTYPVPLSGKLGTGRAAPVGGGGGSRLGSETQTEARGPQGGHTHVGSA